MVPFRSACGLTWAGTGVISGDRHHPVALYGGVSVAWEGGSGTDFIAGDYWTFLGGEPKEHPRRLLVTLNNSTPGEANPFSPVHTFVHAIPDRFTELTVPAAGEYDLRLDVTVGTMLDRIGL